jgi:hypothetical protein
MSREEDKKLLAELMFVGEQLQGNIAELKKLDGLAARAGALNEIDTQKIMDRLNSVSFTQIERKIVDTIREDLSRTRSEILASASAAADAAKELSKKTELLKESSDSLLQIDNMASDLDTLVKSVKNWKTKTIYGAIGLSLFFGISSGAIVSNMGTIFAPTPPESIENAQILSSKFGKIVALQDQQSPKMYYIAIPSHSKIKDVVSFVDNNTRYIRIESK